MYCPKCGAHTDQPPKYCKSCGLKLTDHASLLENPDRAAAQSESQIRREKWLMNGVTLTVITLFNLMIFFCTFYITALQRVAIDAKPGLLWMFLSQFGASLITGGLGVFYLLRSGFFSNFQERQLRLQLALIEQKRKALETRPENVTPEVNSPSLISEAASITEEATRKLQHTPAATTEIKSH